MIELILAGLFALVCGSYGFTWKVYNLVLRLKTNDLHAMEQRASLSDTRQDISDKRTDLLEGRIKSLEDHE